MCPGAFPPVPTAAAAVPVPELCHFLEGVRLGAVQRFEEFRGDRGAPAVSAVRVDAQRLCQQVFLGVYDIYQPPQALRGVLPEPDVWCCTIKVDIGNSKGQYIEKDEQEATKDGSESTKIQHGI